MHSHITHTVHTTQDDEGQINLEVVHADLNDDAFIFSVPVSNCEIATRTVTLQLMCPPLSDTCSGLGGGTTPAPGTSASPGNTAATSSTTAATSTTTAATSTTTAGGTTAAGTPAGTTPSPIGNQTGTSPVGATTPAPGNETATTPAPGMCARVQRYNRATKI